MRASGRHETRGDGPEGPGPRGFDGPPRDRRTPPRPVPGRLTPVLRVSFVLRGVALWFAIHLGMAFLGQIVLSPAQVVFALAVVYAGVVVDQRVRREDLLLGNAGVAPWVGPGHALGAAGVLEAAFQGMVRGLVG